MSSCILALARAASSWLALRSSYQRPPAEALPIDALALVHEGLGGRLTTTS
eukprot:CAMPEP_0197681922 /NCGR_PEP_ID=MMETSP1338-20131121/95691_1 /TAXON_ID=43686 ORGANISM="Pelagodinium beii, Strain RCC1491" /NCGR_SAMPLE_ID=MMETSP1338 /ASSEMBLY_ACC=CAM_ASM_000754 /LENGTH=50 /DNA_ID=CAMNT_0043263329 /DNA_START=175 /DNA_END=327 /DNA_ORIENTATION=-